MAEVVGAVRDFLVGMAMESARSVAGFVDTTHGNVCVYCRAPATENDHLLPSNVVDAYTRSNLVPTVPACGRCNRHLGSRLEPRIDRRARWLAECRGYVYSTEQRRVLAGGGATTVAAV